MSRAWTRPSPEGGSAARWDGPARDLARALERELGAVGFDAGNRGAYATDASNYRQVPIGVVWPRSAEEVEAAVRVCREHGAPIVARGGGTSLAGQCCNLAVVVDCSRHMTRIRELDAGRRTASVEPGIVLDALRAATTPHDLTFGPDPATHTHCTLGGMIGNDSCGVHSVMAGRTADNVRELDVVLYDGTRMTVGATPEDELRAIVAAGGRRGEIYRRLAELRDRHADEIRRRFPKIPRRVSGYNLDELLPEKGFQVARALVGTESTCVTVVGATLDLVPWPKARALVVVGCVDAYAAADLVPEVMALEPIGLEGIDDRLVADQRAKHMNAEDLTLLPEGGGWLFVETGADTREEATEKAERIAERLRRETAVLAVRVFAEPADQARLWEVRESGLGATARVPERGDTWEGWEDSAVDPARLGDYLRDLRRLLDRYDYDGDFYGHFGQGCVHTRISFDLQSAPGVERFRAFLDEAADLCLAYGGSLSGEHGDGQARGELLPKMFGEELVGAFREFKAIWDPDGKMNPGKVVDPYPIVANLRLGAGYRPWEPKTVFTYPDDDGRFSRTTLRCVGVGKCRRDGGGTMCPSYMVTRDERHSTRGRARLLFEMLEGDVVRDGWRSEAVKEALDLCLACKGCKSDCPMHVDMATYKAEFLAHHYRRRLRPRAAYSMGLVHWTARAASRAPGLVNAVTRAPVLGRLVRAAGGLSPRRELPPFARETFRARFARRRDGHGDGRRRVLLFPDTFNQFFHPETAEAAVDVLEDAGFAVEIPPRILCCGRPLYDFGMLGLARRQLRQIVDVLRPAIRAGVPVVVLEPSCCATFRDELPSLLHGDEDAHRLSDLTHTLAEVLRDHAPDWKPRRLARRALAHGHCHHKAVMGWDADLALLRAAGLDVEVPAAGCCGMAGSFGFETDKVDVSLAVGERELLPAVRRAAESTLVVADGFSCREQIEQTTGRRALHTAQVLALVRREGEPAETPDPTKGDPHAREDLEGSR